MRRHRASPKLALGTAALVRLSTAIVIGLPRLHWQSSPRTRSRAHGCAVGGRDAVRHLAHPTLQQVADLRRKRSHRSPKLRRLRNDVGGSPATDSTDSDDPGQRIEVARHE